MAFIISVVTLIAFGMLLFSLGHLVVIGFRRSPMWGLFTLLLFPIAVVIMAIKDIKVIARPLITLALSMLLLFLVSSGLAEVYQVAFLAVTGVIIVYWSKRSEGIYSLSLSTKINFVTNGLEFDSKRFSDLVESEQANLDYFNDKTRPKRVARYMKKPEVVQDFTRFADQKFCAYAEKGQLSPAIWTHQDVELFLQLVDSKYNILDVDAAATLIYICDEKSYAEFAGYLEGLTFENETKYLARVVGYYMTNEKEPNYLYIERYARSLGLNNLKRSNVPQKYSTVEKQIQLMFFEKNLQEETLSKNSTVEGQIRRELHSRNIQDAIRNDLSTDPSDYIIVGQDYSRESRIDNYYRNHFSQIISRAFDGHCCKCGEGMGQLEYDHFWWPKSRGGNFLMRHREGAYVNNCIPLCRSCNSSKGNRDYQAFFNVDEIEGIANISQSLNSQLNTLMVDFKDPDFEGRAF